MLYTAVFGIFPIWWQLLVFFQYGGSPMPYTASVGIFPIWWQPYAIHSSCWYFPNMVAALCKLLRLYLFAITMDPINILITNLNIWRRPKSKVSCENSAQFEYLRCHHRKKVVYTLKDKSFQEQRETIFNCLCECDSEDKCFKKLKRTPIFFPVTNLTDENGFLLHNDNFVKCFELSKLSIQKHIIPLLNGDKLKWCSDRYGRFFTGETNRKPYFIACEAKCR